MTIYFLIYINEISDDLTSKPKLLPDGTSLFSVVQFINSTANSLNSDFIRISDWNVQWKMNFDLCPIKTSSRGNLC